MANDLNRSIKIYIDGTEAANGVKTVEAAIQKLEAKLGALNGTEANYATRSKQLQKEIAAKNKTLQTYKQKIEETNRVLNNLSGATYNQLMAVQSQVRKQLRDAVPGTQKHTAALEQNRRVTEALTRAQSAMRVEVGSQSSVWGRASNFVNKYIGLAGAAIAAITGVSMKLNQLRDQRDKREEAKADVEALTGLDKDSIAWLEQQAIKLSTAMTESGIRIRQSATEILDAYKLVGSAKPELLNDKEALAEVTEQTLILASASGMKLKDAVDAVTLSMNQYGAEADQASRFTNVMAAGSKYGSAAVESVTSAITKSGVAAASAGVPIEQLVGTIETLGEKGIKDEIAGTGLKKFFLTLQTGADETNPAIVGLETALDNLQKKQLSASQIKKQFGEEGYNVASVLINEADKVKYYTQAVTGTTVAMEQAATKSETAAAKRDQAKNKLSEIGNELMNKLNPAITSVMNSTVNWGSRLVTLIAFLTEHSRTIGILTGVVGGYILISKAQIIEEKLKFFWQEKVVASMKRAYAVMLRNPYAAAAAAVLLFIAYLRDMNKELTESERIEKTLTDIRQKSTDSVKTERAEVEQLLGIARNENISKGEREAAIRRLNELSPEYLGNLELEKINTAEATAAVNSYVDSLIVLEDIKRTNEKMNELRGQRDDILKKGPDNSIMEDVQAGAANMLNQFKTSLGLTTDAWADNTLDKYINKGVNEVRSIDNELQVLNNHIEESRKSLIKIESEKPEKEKPLGGGGTPTSEDEAQKLLKEKLDAEKKRIKEFETLRDQELSNQKRAHNSTINAYRQMLSEKRLTQAQYDLFTASAQKQNADTLLNIEQIYHTKSTNLQISNKELKENNISSSAERVEQAEQQSFNARLSAEQTYYKNLSAMRDMVQKPELSPEDKLKAQYDIQSTLLESIYSASLNYARKNGQDESEIEQAHLAAQTSLYEKYFNDKIEIANRARLKMSDFMGDELSQEIATIYDSVTNLQLIFEHFAEADFWKRFKDSIIQNLGTIASATTKSLNSAFSTFQQIEINNIDKRYDAEIVAAEGNSDEIARLEKEKAQKKLDVEKKYADVQFAIKASEIVANTALSIMQAYGQLGPIAGSIAAAILVATGAVQLAAANSERDKVKSMTLEGATYGSNAPKTAQVQVKQWATGRYDVIGQDDGKSYNDVPYIGPAPTGIVRRTSLVSENGAELIINAEDLSRLQKHIDYPVVVQAIQDSRSGRMPQRAEGNYTPIDTPNQQSQVAATDSNATATNISQLLTELKSLIATLRNLKAYVVLRDLREAEEFDRKSKQPFTRSKQ